MAVGVFCPSAVYLYVEANANINPRCLTIKQAALYLGCTVWAVRELLWKGEIPFLRVGKRQVIDIRDLDAFIDARKSYAA